MQRNKSLKKRFLFPSLRPIVASVVIVLLMLSIQLILANYLGIVIPFLLPLIAVIVISFIGGRGVGFAATIFFLWSTDYFFISPHHTLIIASATSVIGLLLFFLEGIFISIFTDIIVGTKSAQQYKRTILHQEQVVTKLQEELAKAQTEIKARDEFLSIASHELKTPLTSMLLQLQTVLYNIRNVSLANFSVQNLLKMLESAEEQSKQIAKMINDLLNVSLITTGKIKLELAPGDIGAAVRDVVDRFAERFEQEGYTVHVSADRIAGQFDKLRLQQAINNLLSNAVKYGNQKPIEVSVKHVKSSAVITIRDHGIGIPKEEQKHIFARFKRAHRTQEQYEGLGVGLYITYQIIHAHHGSIAVKSREGAGSVFIITIPLNSPELKLLNQEKMELSSESSSHELPLHEV